MKRTFSASITIKMDNDVFKYVIIPMNGTTPRDALRGIRLRKLGNERAEYTCLLYPDGVQSCSCPAGKHRVACKHLAVLDALGIFGDEVLAARALALELEGRLDMIRSCAPEAPRYDVSGFKFA